MEINIENKKELFLKKKTIQQLTWDRITSRINPKSSQVDNQRIEELMKGGFLFGFTASDLFIILSAILTLIFLQIQPYLIPYLEGTLNKEEQKINSEILESQKTDKVKIKTPENQTNQSTQSADTKEQATTSPTVD